MECGPIKFFLKTKRKKEKGKECWCPRIDSFLNFSLDGQLEVREGW